MVTCSSISTYCAGGAASAAATTFLRFGTGVRVPTSAASTFALVVIVVVVVVVLAVVTLPPPPMPVMKSPWVGGPFPSFFLRLRLDTAFSRAVWFGGEELLVVVVVASRRRFFPPRFSSVMMMIYVDDNNAVQCLVALDVESGVDWSLSTISY